MASRINFLSVAILLAISAQANHADAIDYDLESLQALSLKDLLNVQVQTASRKKRSLLDAPANINPSSINTCQGQDTFRFKILNINIFIKK